MQNNTNFQNNSRKVTRKPCYRKDDRAVFSLILFTLTATIHCADFHSPEIWFISTRVTFRSFKVIRGHWFWCQSKARMWLPISP